MLPYRKLFWKIEHPWIFYLIVISVSFFVIGMCLLYFSVWKKSLKNQNTKLSKKPLGTVFLDIFLHRRLLKDDLAAGLMHLFIFWGFFLLLIITALLSIHEHIHPFLFGKIYIVFSSAGEFAGLLLFIGCLFALIRRYVQKVPRLENTFEDALMPTWLAIIVLSGFVLEGIRISSQPAPWERFSFVGWLFSWLMKGAWTEAAYPYFWWAHAIISIGFLATIPFTKMFHLLGAPISIYLQNLPKPVSTTLEEDLTADQEETYDQEEFFEDADEKEHLLPRDLDLATVAFLDACMRCGRCVEACPSNGVGEPYAPRDFVQAMRSLIWQTYSPFGDIRFLKRPNKEMLDRLWYCTTCRACLEVCPIYGPTFQLVLSQRELSIEEGTSVPDLLNQTLERLFKYENPWMSSKKEKLGWIEDDMDIQFISPSKQDYEFCYFVGCTTSVDARARSIAKAFASILQRVGINFGILGDKEPCCGDIAKRVGETGLFEEKKEQCLTILEKYNIQKIVTSSPHCYYTLNTDYPKEIFEVNHYTQVLHHLVMNNKLDFAKQLNVTVTYHDPCYLGRHSRIFDEPREVIKAIPGVKLVEMAHNRENSLCCGGGGGRMWQGSELTGEERMGERRAREAADTGAEILITACPLCLIMMEDGIKTSRLDKKLKVMDLNEFVLSAMDTATNV